MQVELKKNKFHFKNPVQLIVSSFFLVALVGGLILTLPICSRDGNFTNFVDAFFTATSATCVTGLVVFDTYSKWTVFGQIIILLLIQVGGLGLVTITTFFNLIIGKKLGFRSSALASESANSTSIFNSVKLIKTVVIVSLCFELVGALLLSIKFVPLYGLKGVFISIFMSVSAFCNAGFDLLGFLGQYSSLVAFNNSPLVLYTIMGLIICGGLGFVVWQDIFNFRKNKKLVFHTKIVLIMTGVLIVSGLIAFLVFEWSNPITLKNMPLMDKINNALFQSVTTRTAGFNSIDNAGLNNTSKMFSIILMFFGAAPGSTGGGVKVTTMAVIIMTVFCIVRGKNDTEILGKRIEQSTVYKAISVVFLGLSALFISTSLILFVNSTFPIITPINTLFETTSAFATVGLTTGVTAVSNIISKYTLILLMLLGRVGPVSLFVAIALKSENRNTIKPDGKLLVG